MGFRINTNINAIDTQRNLMQTSTNMATTMRRLSSGLRINSAADDAAGLAISQKLNAQVTGLNQAVKNSQDGISLVQTAEGALNETQSILQRMRQLAVQSANDTNTATDRTAIQSEMNQLATEMSRISNTTSFNTKNLLAGGFKNQSFQIGANSGETMSLGISAMDASSLNVAANGAIVSSTQNTANLSTIANVSSGFKNNVGYTVKSTAVTAGSLTDANGVSSKGVTQGQNIGNETLNTEGSFAGTAATNYTFRVSGVDATGTKVNQVQYSTDGGSTWATSQGQLQKDGTFAFQAATSSATPTTDSGLTFGFSLPSTGAINPAIGDQFTFSANPTQTATSLAGAAVITTGGAFAPASGGAITGVGNYLGSLSGALSIVVNTTTAGGGATAVVSGVTVNIGTTSFTATSGAAPAATVAASYTPSAAGASATATVNFMGMSFNITGITPNAANGAGTATYTMGTLTPLSASTTTKINASDPGSYTAAVNELTGLPAAGAAASVAATGVTATISGAYTGTTGNLQIRAAAANWTAPTAALITNNIAGTAAVLSNYSFTAASASAASKMTFTYNGATVNVYGLTGAPVAGDTISIALENAAGTPGGNIAVATTNNIGSSTNTTASQNVGNESLNTAGAFVGSATTNYLLKASSVNGTQVTGAKFSTDGGTTWATATATAQSDGSYKFQAQQRSSGGTNGSGGDSGMVFSFTSPTNGVAPQVNDQFSFQAVAGSSYSGAATTVTAIGSSPFGGTTPTATVSGTYTGPYSGAVTINANFGGGTLSSINSIKIGSTTLDASQFQYNTTANTISFSGLTYTLTTAAVTAGNGTITGQTLLAASQGQSANLAGTAALTTANLTGTTAPTVTAAATQIGAGIPGLGAGAILLHLKDFNTGGAASNVGINSVAWEATGSTTVTGFGAGSISAATTNTSADFSYNTTVGHDSYTAGTAYGGTLSVTGADGNAYKIVVANATSAGATVSIQNAAQTSTYATYNVTTSGQAAGDVVALNLTQANVTSSATQNIGAETSAISGTYTGSTNLQYTAKVSQVDTNGNVSQIQLSTDGGQTYGTAIAASAPYSNPAGQGTVTSFNLSNGLTMTMTPGQFNQNKASVGDSFTFTATATTGNGGTGADLLQLQNTDAASGNTFNVGTSQLLQNNQTTATIGAANLTMTASFGALGTTGGIAAGSTTVTSQASQAAVIGANGQVVTNATAYAGLDVTTQSNAQAAISVIDAAINTVSLQRAQLGAIQNRLQHTINNLSVGSENLNAAQSRIMDVDVASETVNMTKNQILEQAGISILAQANQQPQMVLKLLG